MLIIWQLKSTTIRNAVDPRADPLETLDLINLQGDERRTIEVMVVLESNENSIESLSKFYQAQSYQFMENLEISKKEAELCTKRVKDFASHLEDIVRETRMQINHTKLLIQNFQDTKTVVSPAWLP
jgi:ribosomal protein L16 Arg81 hydroxylase